MSYRHNRRIADSLTTLWVGAALAAVSPATLADVVNVPGDQPTIQAGIDAAQAGDEVVIADGTYTGADNKNLDFGGKPITVRSAGGDASLCIIDCQGSGRGFYFHSGETSMAIVDGLTITGGSTNHGTGMLIENSSPTVVNCTISGNTGPVPTSTGGGMRIDNGNPTLIDCTFSGNRSSRGGAIFNAASSPTVTNCTFSENVAISTGGGIYNDAASNPPITNCTFSGNEAEYRGGGMYNRASNPDLADCTFSGNIAAWDGGGMYNNASDPTVTDCSFSDNWASGSGGGMANNTSSPAVTDCSFTGNTAARDGGGMTNGGSSPTLINCLFSENTAGGGGGGMANETASNPAVINCTFRANTAATGGGMRNYWVEPTLANCTFNHNTSSSQGGGMYNWSSSSTLTNCTFANNAANSVGGGMYCQGAFGPTLTSGIFWGDSPDEIAGPATVTFSDVQGGQTGDGNIDADPLFADADGPDDIPGTADDDLRCLAGSPACDAGSNAAVGPDAFDLDGDGDTTEPLPIDLDGNPRFVDDPDAPDCWQSPGECGEPPIVDMGAYELQPTPVCPWDLDDDGSTGIADLLALLAAWGTNPGGPPDFDGDGTVGISDLLELLANWGPCPE
ncbi:MAG: right-handed parallel beta-helix repeat-containing protein [Planctomycetota bacterium]|jgi:parallel beta-helix repeat protein